MRVQPNIDPKRPVMVTARFDVTDADTKLEPSAATFIRSARQTGESTPDFKASLLCKTSGKTLMGKDLLLFGQAACLRVATAGAQLLAPLLSPERVQDLLEARQPMAQAVAVRKARYQAFGVFSAARSHYEIADGKSRPTHRTETDLAAFRDQLASNLSRYPSALHVVHVAGHGLHNQHFGGSESATMLDHLKEATQAGGRRADVLTAESCTVAQLEHLSSLGQVARLAVLPQTVLISGSETMASVPSTAAGAESAEALASQVVHRSQNDPLVPTLAAFDLDSVGQRLMPSLDRLGHCLSSELATGRDASIQSTIERSARVSAGFEGVDLGSFLENLWDLRLSETTRDALVETRQALEASRLAFQTKPEGGNPLAQPVSHSPVSQLQGLSFSIEPGQNSGLPEGWLTFIQNVRRPPVGDDLFPHLVQSAVDRAQASFFDGQPVVLAASNDHSFAAVCRELDARDIPFLTASADKKSPESGWSGVVTVVRARPLEAADSVAEGLACEPFNYKQLAIDFSAATERGQAAITFASAQHADRLRAWLGDDPAPDNPVVMGGQGPALSLDPADYRLDGVKVVTVAQTEEHPNSLSDFQARFPRPQTARA